MLGACLLPSTAPPAGPASLMRRILSASPEAGSTPAPGSRRRRQGLRGSCGEVQMCCAHVHGRPWHCHCALSMLRSEHGTLARELTGVSRVHPGARWFSHTYRPTRRTLLIPMRHLKGWGLHLPAVTAHMDACRAAAADWANRPSACCPGRERRVPGHPKAVVPKYIASQTLALLHSLPG